MRTIDLLGRMLCAFVLCCGLLLTSCGEGPLGNDDKTEQGSGSDNGNAGGNDDGNDDTGSGNEGGNEGGNNEGDGGDDDEPGISESPATLELTEVTAATAVFTGHLDVPASDLAFSQIVIYYSDAANFNVNTAQSVSTVTFDNNQDFTITLTNLKSETKYNYCMVVEVKSDKFYGDVQNFTTLESVGLDFASAEDLSSGASANCYVVSKSGLYKFKTVQGNGTKSVGSVTSCVVLWESFGTDVKPDVNDLISEVGYKDGYLAFQTADAFKEGNAVVAVKDENDNILWSWHIWMVSDEIGSSKYVNSNIVLMDRNIGALSATPGDPLSMGLLYQWGRKDPFLTACEFYDGDGEFCRPAASTIEWPEPVVSSVTTGTIDYSVENPTTFINHGDMSYTDADGYTRLTKDWLFIGGGFIDKTRWQSQKTIYDPCPAGWRVPDANVWEYANLPFIGSDEDDGEINLFDESAGGMILDSKYCSPAAWYPAAGIKCDTGDKVEIEEPGLMGAQWSVSYSSPEARTVYGMLFRDGYIDYGSWEGNYVGNSVRCQKIN